MRVQRQISLIKISRKSYDLLPVLSQTSKSSPILDSKIIGFMRLKYVWSYVYLGHP